MKDFRLIKKKQPFKKWSHSKRLNQIEKEHPLQLCNDYLRFKNSLLQSVVDCNSDGIIVLDGTKKVYHFNVPARQIFEISDGQNVIGEYFIELIRNYNLNMNIEKCILENITFTQEVYYFTNEQKNLKVSYHPSELFNPRGCVLIIQDVTNLKKLEQIRTEFVSNVTHELKTPLTSIRGFVETLRNGAISDLSVAQSFLEIIDIESERLYTLIHDILQLSEIETRSMDDNLTLQKILPIVKEVMEILSPMAAKKHVTLGHQIDEEITIEINRNRLKQLLINLVDNAIKYNKENGSVIIHCHESKGKISFLIEDTGIGIPPEHHPRLFERFYTVDKSRSRKLGGTGLGLSIVKHIVNLYDGNIYFTSATNKGTTFVVEFPASKFKSKPT